MRAAPTEQSRSSLALFMTMGKTGQKHKNEVTAVFRLAVATILCVSVNVLEAKQLAWSNTRSTNSYVLVVLGKSQHRTAVVKKMQDPYYGELFFFELFLNIREVLRSSLWLGVMESNRYMPPRLVGETNIELSAIWAQPNHQILKQWIQLSLPKGVNIGPVGFLKLDVSIISRGDALDTPAIHNFYYMTAGCEQQKANYLITVYGAYSLPNEGFHQVDRRAVKPPNSFVRVSFCGLMAKTAIQSRSNNPVFNEQISIVEMFPNLSRILLFEVCTPGGPNSKVLASNEITLEQISHDGENGFLPIFGPTLFHLNSTFNTRQISKSGDELPYYGGALLLSVKTVAPDPMQNLRTVSVEPVEPLITENLWDLDEFCIMCPLFEVSMLDLSITGTMCGVAVTMGEVNEQNTLIADLSGEIQEIRNQKLHYTRSLEVINSMLETSYMPFIDGYPVLQLASKLPDFRFRMFRNNMIQRIVLDLEHTIQTVETRLKEFDYQLPKELLEILRQAAKEAITKIIKYNEMVKSTRDRENLSLLKDYSTELDQKQFAVQAEEMEKMKQMLIDQTKEDSSLCETRRGVKDMLFIITAIVHNMENIIYLKPRAWSDIVIWILSNGSRVGYYKIPANDVIFSDVPEQCGVDCARIQTLLLKPLKCPRHTNLSNCLCVAAKVETLLWMGLYNQKSEFAHYVPPGYKIERNPLGKKCTLRSYSMVIECRAFVYRGKFPNERHNSNLCTFVRINIVNTYLQTKVQKSLNPEWDEMLKTYRSINMSSERLSTYTPVVIVEVFAAKDSKAKTEVLGRFRIQPEVTNRMGQDRAPPLKWYSIESETDIKGKIQMSVQFIQVKDSVLQTAHFDPIPYSQDSNTVQKPPVISADLPAYLKPSSPRYKLDLFWWGLRDITVAKKPCVVLEIDDLKVKSDVISVDKANCNFNKPCHRFYIVETPLEDVLKSTLRVKLYDKSTFGRTVLLGYCVKNPRKYLVNWLTKSKRQLLMKSFTNCDYVKVHRMLYATRKMAQNSISDAPKEEPVSSGMNKNIAYLKTQFNLSKWWPNKKSKIEDEECALLPVHKDKEKKHVIHHDNHLKNGEDWWWKFYVAQKKDCQCNGLVVYKCKLEDQPDFFKFKDWCTTLRFYNGKKIGIPEKDQQLYRGSLKIGIGLYCWPPPPNTFAVTRSGKELNKNMFKEFPTNEPLDFIVRVYIVKGMKLGLKDSNNVVSPYLVINCGKNNINDRKNFIPLSDDPIFGRTYTLRGTIPEDYRLTVSVYNYDVTFHDELIGSTSIDIEDRIYTKHRARVGLAAEYRSDSTTWRDRQKPSVILDEQCRRNRLGLPEFPDDESISIHGIVYRYDEEEFCDSSYSLTDRRENLCLRLLHNWQTVPISGYSLVPEHVETRPLYLDPEHPGTKMGSLQMWVDIYTVKPMMNLPPPVDITPPKSEPYELSVTIRTISNLTNIKGQPAKTRHRHLKVWLGDPNMHQKTNEIKKCFDGDLFIDWQTYFGFNYDYAKEEERKQLLTEDFWRERHHEWMTILFYCFVNLFIVMSLDNEEVTKFMGQVPLPPRLVIQFWDGENLLGESMILLDKMQKPLISKETSIENLVGANEDVINLFLIQTPISGWVPLNLTCRKANYFTGLMDIELWLRRRNVVREQKHIVTLVRTISREIKLYQRIYIIVFLVLAVFIIFILISPYPMMTLYTFNTVKKCVIANNTKNPVTTVLNATRKL